MDALLLSMFSSCLAAAPKVSWHSNRAARTVCMYATASCTHVLHDSCSGITVGLRLNSPAMAYPSHYSWHPMTYLGCTS